MTEVEIGPPLLALARAAIAGELGLTRVAEAAPPEFAETGATFVTLRHAGELRGCIGTVNAWRPLGEDVRANAVAAAFRDPRFPPLRRDEYPGIAIEVSLLRPSEPVLVENEELLLAALRPGVDGVVLEHARYRATFLPQVWEQLPDPREFMRALKRKAGLPESYWNSEIRVSRYTVGKYLEEAAG